MRLLKRFFAHCVCICLAHCFRLIIFWDKPQQVSTKKLFWGSCVTVSVKASPAKTDRQPSGDFGQPTQKESIDHEKASSFCPMVSVFESFKKILVIFELFIPLFVFCSGCQSYEYTKVLRNNDCLLFYWARQDGQGKNLKRKQIYWKSRN